MRIIFLATLLLAVPACSSSSSGAGSAGAEGGTSGDSGASDSGGAQMQTEGGPLGDAGSSGPSDAGGAPANMLGSVGLGPIMCMYANDGGFDASCPPGTVCCEGVVSQFDTCASGFAECACSGGGCPVVGCATPADCPGKQCCVDVDSFNQITATSCKASCASNELLVCSTPNDCKPVGPCSAYGGVSGTNISTCL